MATILVVVENRHQYPRQLCVSLVLFEFCYGVTPIYSQDSFLSPGRNGNSAERASAV